MKEYNIEKGVWSLMKKKIMLETRLSVVCIEEAKSM